MAIVVGHEPVAALGQLATEAGQAQGNVMEQQQKDKSDLLKLQQDNVMQRLAFMRDSEVQARSEQLQYNVLLAKQKQSIDMQTELAGYARQKQMLQQTMNMIGDSNEFDDREKEELRLQAMSKYANVGTGITPGSMAATDMERRMMKGEYSAARIKALQEEVDSGELNPLLANQRARGEGFGDIDFYTNKDLQNTAMIQIGKERSRILRDKGKTGLHRDKKGVLDAYGTKVPTDSVAYNTFVGLEKEEESAMKQMAKLYDNKEEEQTGFSKNRNWGSMSEGEQDRWLNSLNPETQGYLLTAINLNYPAKDVYETWQKFKADNSQDQPQGRQETGGLTKLLGPK